MIYIYLELKVAIFLLGIFDLYLKVFNYYKHNSFIKYLVRQIIKTISLSGLFSYAHFSQIYILYRINIGKTIFLKLLILLIDIIYS